MSRSSEKNTGRIPLKFLRCSCVYKVQMSPFHITPTFLNSLYPPLHFHLNSNLDIYEKTYIQQYRKIWVAIDYIPESGRSLHKLYHKKAGFKNPISVMLFIFSLLI